ncbi:MAG: efflux RND transporter periplasmic adaptor subunit [Candidatus Eremiobacterota bacterium]
MADEEELPEAAPPPPPARRSPWPALLALLAGVALGAWLVRPRPHEPAPQPSQRAWTGPTATVVQREVPEVLELTGTLEAERTATLATRLSGRITYLELEEGDPVYAGQVVARVDVSDLASRTAQAQAGEVVAAAGTDQARAGVLTAESALKQARAQVSAIQSRRGELLARLELARSENQRQSFLAREGAVPQQTADQALAAYEVARSQSQQLEAELTSARAAVDAARSRLEEARSSVASSQAVLSQARAGTAAVASDLAYGEIVAPFPGVVIRKFMHQGELATPGAPLLEVQDVHHLQLEVAVPEEQLGRFKLGQRLPVEVGGRSVSSRVRQVVPSADPASRSFLVKLAIVKARDLIPGLYGRLRLPTGKRTALFVPARAVTRRGQLEQVTVVDPVELRLVKTAPAAGDEVEILSGLKAGERVGLP